MFSSAAEQVLKLLNATHSENKSVNSRQNKLCVHLIHHGGAEGGQ